MAFCFNILYTWQTVNSSVFIELALHIFTKHGTVCPDCLYEAFYAVIMARLKVKCCHFFIFAYFINLIIVLY